MPEIQRLYELQGVDLELDWRNARLSEITKALGDESSLVPLRDEVHIAEAAVKVITAKQHDLDQIIGGFDVRIAEGDAKLYGGTIKLARELQDLQADIAMIKRQRGEQEDMLLLVLEEGDAARDRYNTGSTALATAEEAWSVHQASMTEERGKLQMEVVSLISERATQATTVTAGDLALYEQVRKARKGKAIAILHGSTCDSCKVGIPNKLVQEARSEGKIVRCSNCGLILLPE